MIHAVTHAALRLDLWLQKRLGRPYNTLLAVGLTIEVVRRLLELPAHISHAPRLAWTVALIAMNLALLIHQVGELSHHLRRRSRRDADGRRGRVTEKRQG